MDKEVIIQDVTLAATINGYLKKNVHNFKFTEDELKKYFSTFKELVINSRSAFDEYSQFFKYYSSLEKIQINLTGYSYENTKFASEKIINMDWIKNNKSLKELIVNGVNFEELDLTDLKKLEIISIKHAQGLKKIDYSTENLFELMLLDTNLQKVPHFEEIIKESVDVKLDINLLPILKRDYKNLYEYMSTFSNDKIWMEKEGVKNQSFSNGKILMYDKKVDEIISSVTNEKMSDLQKMTVIYDYIIRNVYYDHKTRNARDQKTNPFDIDPILGVSISGMTTKEAYDYQQSGVKALLDGTSVCEGYANLYTYFLRKLGMESNCIVVQTDAGYHAITRVKYNGNYYYFDPTWDTIVDKDGKIEDCNAKYFMLNKEEMSKDHFFVCDGENDLPNTEFSLNDQIDRLKLISLLEEDNEKINDGFLKIIDQLTGEYIGYKKIPNGGIRFNDVNQLVEQYRKILKKLDESSDELSFKNLLELKKVLLKEENRLQNEIMKTQSNNSSFHV